MDLLAPFLGKLFGGCGEDGKPGIAAAAKAEFQGFLVAADCFILAALAVFRPELMLIGAASAIDVGDELVRRIGRQIVVDVPDRGFQGLEEGSELGTIHPRRVWR